MQIKEIMTSGIEAISSNAYLSQVAKKMQNLDVGVLAVQENNNITGMITGRDIIVRAIAEDKDPRITLVSEVMTHDLSCCSENDTVEEAGWMMENKNLHRLLVLGDDNRPVGIVSLSDIAVKAANEHLTWEVLGRISEPAHPNR